MKIAIHHPAPAFDSYRAALVRSLFNADGIGFDLDADLPIDGPDAEPWQIGLVVGPSGSGKSSIGARIWGPVWACASSTLSARCGVMGRTAMANVCRPCFIPRIPACVRPCAVPPCGRR